MLAPKVSIIIPVYNAAMYLHRCLYSAVTQSLKNIEIVVVNDASTDGSLQIIEEFITLDKRIKFINFSKNKGNGIGRNTALRAACGTYVLFLDADDWLNKNAAKILYNAASKNKSDVVLMGYTQHYMTSKKKHISCCPIMWKISIIPIVIFCFISRGLAPCHGAIYTPENY